MCLLLYMGQNESAVNPYSSVCVWQASLRAGLRQVKNTAGI